MSWLNQISDGLAIASKLAIGNDDREKELDQKIQDLQSQIKQKDDRIQQLNDSNPEESSLLKQKLNTAAKHLKSLTQENQRLNQLIIDTPIQTHDSIQTLPTSETHLHEQQINDIRQAHQKEIEDIQMKHDAFVDTLTVNSDAKLAELEDALFDNDMELTDVKAERDMYVKKLIALNGSISASESMVNSPIMKSISIESGKDNSLNEITSLEVMNVKLDQKVKELSRLVDDLKGELKMEKDFKTLSIQQEKEVNTDVELELRNHELTTVNQGLNVRIEQQDAEIHDFKVEIVNLNQRLELEMEEIANLQVFKESATEKYNVLTLKYEETSQNYNALHLKYTEMSESQADSSATIENERLVQKVLDLEQEIIIINDTHFKSETESSDPKEIHKLETDISTKDTKIEMLIQSISDKDDQVKQLLQDFVVTESLLSDEQQKLIIMQEQHTTLQTSFAALDSLLNSKCSELVNAGIEIEKLIVVLESNEGDTHILQERIAAQSRASKEAKVLFDEHVESNMLLKFEMIEMNRKLNDMKEFSGLYKNAQLEIEKLQESIDRKGDLKDNGEAVKLLEELEIGRLALYNYKNTEDSLLYQVAELKSEAQDYENLVEELKDQLIHPPDIDTLETMTLAHANLEQQINDSTIRYSTLNNEHMELNILCEKLKTQLQDRGTLLQLPYTTSFDTDSIISVFIVQDGWNSDESTIPSHLIQLWARINSLVSVTREDAAQISEHLKTITAEKQKLLSDQGLLLEKLTSMKEFYTERLESEISESNTMRTQLTTLTHETETLHEALLVSNEQLSHLVTNTDSTLSAQLTTLTDTHSKSLREIQRLRQHLIEAEELSTQEQVKQGDMLEEYKSRVEMLVREKLASDQMIESERETFVVLKNEEQIAADNLESLLKENNRLCEEIRVFQVSLENLQSVLLVFQTDEDLKFRNINLDFERKLHQLETQIDEFKQRSESAEAELGRIDGSADDVEKLKQDLAEKNKIMGKLRHDVVQYQSHLSEALKRMNTDDSVDRSLISNLLIQYISAPRGEKTRVEMLSVIGGILKFDEEEKRKCGLGNTSSSGLPRTEMKVKESFTDMWISFLNTETSNPDLNASSASPT